MKTHSVFDRKKTTRATGIRLFNLIFNNYKFIMEKEIATFFRNFALRTMLAEHADPNNPKDVKQAMLNHYEDIYPAFSQTDIFKRCYNKHEHERMVAAYKENFTLLLNGRIPQ